MRHDGSMSVTITQYELEAKLSGKGDGDNVGDYLPRTCSVKHLFEVCLDICGMPR